MDGLQVYTFSLPHLPYSYDAFEPVISKEIMEIHHKKHHQAYITNYNNALHQLNDAIYNGEASTALSSCRAPSNSTVMLITQFSRRILLQLRKAGNLLQEGGGEPPKMNAEGVALQGSGWVWLGLDKELKRLLVETTANQDLLIYVRGKFNSAAWHRC